MLPQSFNIKNLLNHLSVIDLINCPTRYINMQTTSLLDHIYCNNFASNTVSGSISYDISDYNPVFVMIPKNKVSPASRPPCEILK